jgi:hypothetical protein
MDMTYPVADAQQLYKQWQDGKLLDNEERQALRPEMAPESRASFADFLKSFTELDA